MMVKILSVILAALCVWLAWRLLDLQERFQISGVSDFAYIEGIADIIDKVELYNNSSHAFSLAEEAERLARRLGLDEKNTASLHIACLLHDCGMANLNRDMLRKSTCLDEEEWFLLRTHPIIGELALRKHLPAYDCTPSFIRWHHEKFDGTGYPDRLMGDEIPLAARILSLADAVVAMRSERPYRKALEENQIKDEIRKQAGFQFDPAVVRAFLESEGHK